MHLLCIIGYIQPEKCWELKKTYQLVLLNKPRENLAFNLTSDVMDASLYCFISIWPDRESMDGFMGSPEYKLLTGAFKVLGFIQRRYCGELISNEEETSAESKGDF